MIRFLIYFLLLFALGNIYCDDSSEEGPRVRYQSYSNEIEFWLDDINFTLSEVKCSLVVAEHPRMLEQYSDDNEGKVKCIDLSPCTQYKATAIIYNNADNSSVHKSLKVQTSGEANVTITKIIPEQLAIYVEWKTTNPSCIEKYIIKADAEGDSKEVQRADNTLQSYKFDNLNPCLLYAITLATTDIFGKQLEDQKGSIETLFKEPGDVTNLNFTNIKIDSSSIKVNWTAPPFATCVESYFLYWKCIGPECTPNNYRITNPKLTEHTIEHPDACYEYDFAIGTTQEKLNVLGKFYTRFLIPSAITNFQASKDSYLNTVFEWNQPKYNHNCIKHYEFSFIGPNQFESPSTNIKVPLTQTSYNITEVLEPCGNYTVSLLVVLKSFEYGELIQKYFNVAEEQPGGIQDAKVKYIYPKEILLKFRNSSKAGLCVEKYRINCWPTDHTEVKTTFFEKTLSFFIINNLSSCMAYDVQIIAITYSKKEGDPVVLPVTTSSQVTSKPVLDESADRTHNSIQLRGGNTDKANRCEVLFAKFQCRAQSNEAEINYAEKIVQADVGVSKFTAMMHPLSPFTFYQCTINLYNVAGWSSAEAKGIFQTSSYFPQIPTSIDIESYSNSTFNIQWLPPKYMNGELRFYKVYIQSLGPAYKLSKRCQKPGIKILNQDTSRTEFNHTEAYSYFTYSAQIAVTNDFATGKFSPPTFIVTQPSVSDPIDDLTLVSIEGPEVNSTEYEANVTLKWLPPCQPNGIIKMFTIELYGNKPQSGLNKITNSIVNPLIDDAGYVYWSQIIHQPEYNYTAAVSISIHDVVEESESKTLTFMAPAGIPEKFPEPEKHSSVDSLKSKNPTNSAVVRFSKKIFESNMGKIMYAAILLSEMNCQQDPELKAAKYDVENGWPKVKQWRDVKNENCISQYQTTPIKWQPDQRMLSEIQERSKLKTNENSETNDEEEIIEYVIGNDQTCKDHKDFCNGPLRASTKYKMILRTFTKNGYRDSFGIEFKTDEVIQFYLILLLILIVLLVAFFLGFIYLWVNNRKLWNRQSINGIEDAVGDVSTKNFLLHYSKLSAKDKVQREFKDLTVVAQDVCIASTISKYNESKNRYSNIYPYEKNRVILNIDSEGSDYINASFINGYKHRKEYIATQGPKPESFIDFWKMVLEYKVKVVVMVTQFVEGNVIKCHQYYPLIVDKDMKFGNNITITCKNQTENDIYERRELILQHGIDEVQTVVHYLFKRWPDHNVPSDPSELILFVKRVKSEKIPSRSPIVVHCSAGVGRTGTFIALDIIIQKIKNESKINIYETVKSLRFQRMKMVQSIHQYQFLYNCTLELVKRKYEKSAKSKAGKLFFFKTNSSGLFQQNDDNNVNGNGVCLNSNGISDSKLKNNLSNNSIISNGTIKGGVNSSSSSSGFSRSSRNSFNPNDIESVM